MQEGERFVSVHREFLYEMRHRRGLSREALAVRVGTSVRMIRSAEEGRPFPVRFVREIERTLGLAPGSLAVESMAPSFLRNQFLPETGVVALDKLLEASAVADMQGRHDDAILGFERALQQGRQVYDTDAEAMIRVRLATAMDNGGRPDDAREELLRITGSQTGPGLSRGIFYWARYHLARVYLRLADPCWIGSASAGVEPESAPQLLDWAEAIFQEIAAQSSEQGVAAIHQLGATFLARAKAKIGEPAEMLSKARDYLNTADESWGRSNNYRQGYSVRRLAEITRIEGDEELALEQYLEAFMIFVRHNCWRYIDEVRDVLIALLRSARSGRNHGSPDP